MGVWIDEDGRIVRPAEPAWTSTRTDVFGGKPLAIDGEAYVAALRDWVTYGDRSRHVLTDAEFAQRTTPRSPGEMEAEASFKLAVWLQRSGDIARAAPHFERAQALVPENWNYHRQPWSFSPEASAKWLEKFLRTEQPYYARSDISS